jgi:queuine/archaeosine tRNA-ribosyltransferase
MFKKPKFSKEDLNKIGSTIQEIKECPYCSDLKRQIKECMEKHNVKNNLKSATWHNLKCSDCRAKIMLIAECKKKRHK